MLKLRLRSQSDLGKLFLKAEHGFKLPEKTLIDQFDVSLMRGDRIALVGPNGVARQH